MALIPPPSCWGHSTAPCRILTASSCTGLSVPEKPPLPPPVATTAGPPALKGHLALCCNGRSPEHVSSGKSSEGPWPSSCRCCCTGTLRPEPGSAQHPHRSAAPTLAWRLADAFWHFSCQLLGSGCEAEGLAASAECVERGCSAPLFIGTGGHSWHSSQRPSSAWGPGTGIQSPVLCRTVR